MCVTCQDTVVNQVRVVTSLTGTTVNNGLSLDSGFLQLGAPLIKNTDITGAYELNLGTSASRLNTLRGRTSSVLLLENSNGSNVASVQIDGTGILITDTTPSPKGLRGAASFLANYDDNTYVQKVYVDNRIGGRNVNTLIKTAAAGQNGYIISYNHPGSEYTLISTATALGTIGADTQVIFNQAGTLSGSTNFTFSSTTLSAPNIELGKSNLAGGRVISVISQDANASLDISPKADGNLTFGIKGGLLRIGDSASTTTLYKLTANGSQSQIDLYLEPKGTDGKIYIGNTAEAGALRYIKASGNAADISLILQSKGTGNINADALRLGIGYSATTGVVRELIAEGSEAIIHLYIGGKHGDSYVRIGSANETAASRYLEPSSNSATCNLIITGKNSGANGKVYVNGFTEVELVIGNWNMDNTSQVPVNHNLDSTKIVSVEILIRSDSDPNLRYPVNFVDLATNITAATYAITASQIVIERKTGGFYDSTSFDDTGFSRGTIYIKYRL